LGETEDTIEGAIFFYDFIDVVESILDQFWGGKFIVTEEWAGKD
jgi:hypothetical protein